MAIRHVTHRECSILRCSARISNPRLFCTLHWDFLSEDIRHEIVEAWVDRFRAAKHGDDPGARAANARLKVWCQRAADMVARGENKGMLQ